MTTQHERDVATLRAFNRTYTSRLGLLGSTYDGSPFTLSEARILYELANRASPMAAEIARALRLDPAQVSRTVKRFLERGLVAVRENPAHGRHQLLSLTDEGRAAFAALDASTRAAVGTLIESLSPFQRSRLLSAAVAINEIFDGEIFDGDESTVTLRGLRPGDLGLITARQAILYSSEYGWNGDYEALAARILADFHHAFDPRKDDAWIAEVGGRMVGSILLVDGGEPGVAKLRLLYVEPDARGMGVGGQLVASCVARARALGYGRLDLWTVGALTAAGRLYRRAGFVMTRETPNHRFGHDLVDQSWSLDLAS